MPGEDVRATLRSLARSTAAEAVADLSGNPSWTPTRGWSSPRSRCTGTRVPVAWSAADAATLGAAGHRGRARGRGHRHGQADGQDGGRHPSREPTGRLRPRAGGRVDGPGGPPEPVLVRAAHRPDLDRLLEIARAGGPRRLRLPGGRGAVRDDHHRLPPLRRGPGGRDLRLERARRPRRRGARAAGRGRARGQRRRAAARAHARDRVRDPGRGAGGRRCRTWGRCACCAGPGRGARRGGARAAGAAQLDAGLARWIAPERVANCVLRPEPATALPPRARVACFMTAQPGAEAALREGSRSTWRGAAGASRPTWRGAADLASDVEAAARERCDVFLTELKAAAIDVVAEAAARAGAQVVFLRNRAGRAGGGAQPRRAAARARGCSTRTLRRPGGGGTAVSAGPGPRGGRRPPWLCAATTGCRTPKA